MNRIITALALASLCHAGGKVQEESAIDQLRQRVRQGTIEALSLIHI